MLPVRTYVDDDVAGAGRAAGDGHRALSCGAQIVGEGAGDAPGSGVARDQPGLLVERVTPFCGVQFVSAGSVFGGGAAGVSARAAETGTAASSRASTVPTIREDLVTFIAPALRP
ncbi:hypothetical protein [Streptomyces sp. KL116D]|uniref:hypothetical protein n=1 Tax=Streptomyces sp. KL116D TaxID=3045152 RepID=UPI0035583CF1